jgi:hypothetical protein
MALNDVIFNKQQGGLGRALPGSDYLSGMLFFSSTLPSGFTTTLNKKQVLSVADAENLGIVDTYIDETPARAIYTVSGTVTVGDTFAITVTEKAVVTPENVTGIKAVSLGTATVSTAATATGAATDIAAKINSGTYQHGYTATSALGVVTLIARPGCGIMLNPTVSTDPLAVVVTGTSTGVITQQFGTGSGGATAGLPSKLALWHYHISEYFRIQPQGNLWIGFYPDPSTYNFVELQDLQNYANGTMRQCFIYHVIGRTAAQVASDATAIQAVCTSLDALHMPLSVMYAPNIKTIADLTTLLNLSTLTANKVSINISQDGAGTGAYLYIITGASITTGGALLGAVSLAAVNEDIAWVAKFNMSNGVECDTPAFSNGLLASTLSSNLLTQLDSYRYIFLRTYVDIAGSYFNDSHTAIAQSSDYAYIENNRVIDKAIRVGRAALLPQLNSPIAFNADGTLTNNTIAYFRGLLIAASAPLIRAGEISAAGITIDPSQPALTTNSIYITFQIVPTGVARNIIVNIGYVKSL